MKPVLYVLTFVFALSTIVLCDNTTGVTTVTHETNTSTVDHLRGASDTSDDTQTNNPIDKDKNQYKYEGNNRNRRSSDNLVRFFKTLFVKPEVVPEVKSETWIIKPNDTEVKSASDRRSNIDIESNRIESILYKLDMTLNKMIKVLYALTDRINLSLGPMYRSKRDAEIPDVTVLKLNDSVTGTKSDTYKNITVINVNETENAEDKTRRTDSGNEFKFVNTDSDEVITPKISNKTASEIRNNNVTYRIDHNNTKELSNDITNGGNDSDNITNDGSDSNNDINMSIDGRRSEESDLLIKTAVRNIQNQINSIKSHRIASKESYKMGYVVSSLQTLESTLQKIMRRMPLERDGEWVRKMSEKIALSNRLVSDLMNHLE